jgi:hypothetical protein
MLGFFTFSECGLILYQLKSTKTPKFLKIIIRVYFLIKTRIAFLLKLGFTPF